MFLLISIFFGDAMGPGRRNRCKQPTYVPPREFSPGTLPVRFSSSYSRSVGLKYTDLSSLKVSKE